MVLSVNGVRRIFCGAILALSTIGVISSVGCNSQTSSPANSAAQPEKKELGPPPQGQSEPGEAEDSQAEQAP